MLRFGIGQYFPNIWETISNVTSTPVTICILHSFILSYDLERKYTATKDVTEKDKKMKTAVSSDTMIRNTACYFEATSASTATNHSRITTTTTTTLTCEGGGTNTVS